MTLIRAIVITILSVSAYAGMIALAPRQWLDHLAQDEPKGQIPEMPRSKAQKTGPLGPLLEVEELV